LQNYHTVRAHKNKTRASRIRNGGVPQAGQSNHSPRKF
jgi:hypothetical protein